MSDSKNRGVFGVLLMVFVFFTVLMIFAFYTMKVFKDSSSEFGDLSEKDGQIAVVEVEGVILESKKVIENLIRAEKKKSIKAIIVRVDSPGGAVGPTQEIYEEIKRIDQKKPVYASFGSIAASGGYYIGAATRKVFSNPGTLTGSIGVIMQFIDLSKLYEFAKISHSSIKSGRFKDIGQPYRSLTEEEKDLMKDMMKGVHKQFVGDILKRRKEKIKGDIWQIAQGQVFNGDEAMRLGLVDEMGSLWAAGRKIHEELKLEGEFGLLYIKEKKKFNMGEFLDTIDDAISPLGGWKSLVSNIPMFLHKN